MRNILDYSLKELKQWMEANGENAFRAKQVFDWIYKAVASFDEMKNLPKNTKEKLKEYFFIGIPEITHKYDSINKDTAKYLLKLSDGNVIEAVYMKYNYGNSVCLSTQIGCRMGCSFCASTIGGRIRDLTSGDILGEILAMEFNEKERVSNIVLMGSGEPFDNYENVTKFLELVNSKDGLNIGARHITLSTCGLVPGIIRFADLKSQVTLAISLHAPNDELRKTMMPIANKYSIKEILEACNYYIEKTNRRITFEYSLVKDVNDTEDHARELSALLKGILCHVNLIPVNVVKESGFSRPSDKAVMKFKKILDSNGIEATIRKEMGADINAACGQLRRNYLEKRGSNDGFYVE
ncbi:23S rRNA (adenine(2503)-C(2))-methyltransferase RlmN [Clostridium cellulovorans]|uniref:Probable dual-specificity RNA methyltransferase RlmN n=1 Tax=Clostridium cellulovorans (strain ATCC 35296 / DSM 3052 / OCM 3 / 743B) TaxID=573061 RepID=D9SLA4_CLOC7|nr:23S rRNA (adenine(2503)-C(2))-methyltransferase RlmN [Clostridium cellulovorans]ADL51620.1 radical SAM enzyme, Cfr family [Clostridium cellulovorans 743B]